MEPSTHTGVPTPRSAAESTQPTPTRARMRTVLACNPCRRKKIKCDGTIPCPKCVSARKEQDCIYGSHSRSRSARTPLARSLAPKPASSTTSQTVDSEARALRPNSALDDPVANKKQRELRAGIAAFNSDTHAYQFYGPSSHFSFVQRLYQRIRRQSHQPLLLEVKDRVPEGLRQWVSGFPWHVIVH